MMIGGYVSKSMPPRSQRRRAGRTAVNWLGRRVIRMTDAVCHICCQVEIESPLTQNNDVRKRLFVANRPLLPTPLGHARTSVIASSGPTLSLTLSDHHSTDKSQLH